MLFRHSGAGQRPEPGIHNHEPFHDGNVVQTNALSCLWIPGSLLRSAPE
jgi:hypothetical protein